MKSIQRNARFAGVLYLVITAAAILAHIYVPSLIIVSGDAAATANNIVAFAAIFFQDRQERRAQVEVNTALDTTQARCALRQHGELTRDERIVSGILAPAIEQQAIFGPLLPFAQHLHAEIAVEVDFRRQTVTPIVFVGEHLILDRKHLLHNPCWPAEGNRI